MMTKPNETTGADPASALTNGFDAGWIVEHHMYGKWFMPRAGVVADWKKDYAQAYPDNPPREPEPAEVDTWFAEQITWIETRVYGRQVARPDMADVERRWLDAMSRDTDWLSIERDVVEVGPTSNAALTRRP